MRIVEVHLDGFGIFANKHLTGFKSGVNVVYGENESGKTTFLEFVRRILFGFPRVSPSTNPYPPLQGGVYGGKLICKLPSGEDVTIARSEGPRGGRVKVLFGSRELVGRERLNEVLGHIGRLFYENVYAISLNELQAFKTLQEEEVRSHIYGAGLGLGSVSLSAIKGELTKSCERLYKSRGPAHEMAKLHNEIKKFEREIREIQQQLSQYDSLSKQQDELIKETAHLTEQIRDLEGTLASLENKRKMYPSYVELVNAQSELSGLEELADFPEDAKDNLDSLNRDIAHLDSQISKAEEKLKALELKLGGLDYNKDILDKEPIVVSLQRRKTEYENAVRDLKEDVEPKRNALAKEIQKEIIKLGEGWSETSSRDFELSHSLNDNVHSYKKEIEEAKRTLDSAKSKLKLHREASAAQAPLRFMGPNSYRYAIYAVAGLGLMGTIGGLLSSQWSLAAFSAIFLGIGIAVLFKIRNWDQIKSIDTLENTLMAELGQAESEYERLDKDWRAFLRDTRFHESLSPEGALEVVRAIQDTQSHLSQLDEYDERIDRMQRAIYQIKELHDEVAPCIERSYLSDRVNVNMEILDRHLKNAQNTRKNRENIEEQIGDLTREIQRLKESRDEKEQEKRDYISSSGAVDEENLRRKCDAFARQAALNAEIDRAEGIIQSNVGTDKHYDDFIETVSSTTPPEIERELNEVNNTIRELREKRDKGIRATGELKKQLEQLSSSQELLEIQYEYELRRQQLLDCSRDWVKLRIAEVMLNRATSKYENTRQPGVIRAASSIFSNITNHKYREVKKLAESDEIRVLDEYGTTKDLSQLSRGTQEELYFAMRLGLIKEYESRSESMPIIMDDILVNFDDERGPLAIEALNDFAKDRQVIVLTCHKAALDIYKKHGANEISLN